MTNIFFDSILHLLDMVNYFASLNWLSQVKTVCKFQEITGASRCNFILQCGKIWLKMQGVKKKISRFVFYFDCSIDNCRLLWGRFGRSRTLCFFPHLMIPAECIWMNRGLGRYVVRLTLILVQVFDIEWLTASHLKRSRREENTRWWLCKETCSLTQNWTKLTMPGLVS